MLFLRMRVVIVEALRRHAHTQAPPRGGIACVCRSTLLASGNQFFQTLPDRSGGRLDGGFERQHRVVLDARLIDVRQLRQKQTELHDDSPGAGSRAWREAACSKLMRAMRLSIEPYALPLMIEIEKIQGAAYGITVTVRHVGSLSKIGSRRAHACDEYARVHARSALPSRGDAKRTRAANRVRGEGRTGARKRSAHAAQIKGARGVVLRTATRTVCLIG
ncbi:hypothetical protein [Burkholderia sp. BDU5]|uniref:hypothetical protein n=1 Tax=Burkholderia sp. BDU5 TaxID=1385590 RepID=UPI0018D23951|nr:hypothetical protein [Burkholderia sp. BDU5]